MFSENFGDRNLDPTDDTHNAEPVSIIDQKDVEKNPEKPTDKTDDIKNILALGKENADKYALNNSDAKAAIENDIQKADTEEKMLDNWPA